MTYSHKMIRRTLGCNNQSAADFILFVFIL